MDFSVQTKRITFRLLGDSLCHQVRYTTPHRFFCLCRWNKVLSDKTSLKNRAVMLQWRLYWRSNFAHVGIRSVDRLTPLCPFRQKKLYFFSMNYKWPIIMRRQFGLNTTTQHKHFTVPDRKDIVCKQSWPIRQVCSCVRSAIQKQLVYCGALPCLAHAELCGAET
jgi:hypothetical protein